MVRMSGHRLCMLVSVPRGVAIPVAVGAIAIVAIAVRAFALPFPGPFPAAVTAPMGPVTPDGVVAPTPAALWPLPLPPSLELP
jgi:hypothetical protein